MNKTNEAIKIEVSSPILREGFKISTKTSKKYSVQSALDLLEIAREINLSLNKT